MYELLHLSTSRKPLVLTLFRNILKELMKFKNIDYFISDYHTIVVKNKFLKYKNEGKLDILNTAVMKGEDYLEKLRTIDVCYYKA